MREIDKVNRAYNARLKKFDYWYYRGRGYTDKQIKEMLEKRKTLKLE